MESAGFLENVNSGQEEVTRYTSFAMKLVMKAFHFEKLGKIWGKRAFFNY